MTISWSKLCKDPNSWIQPECAPDGFRWADPSKLRIGEVFRLLDHWRERQKKHLDPLIWMSTCPLLKGVPVVRKSSSEKGDEDEDEDEDEEEDEEEFPAPSSHEKSDDEDDSEEVPALSSSDKGNESDRSEESSRSSDSGRTSSRSRITASEEEPRLQPDVNHISNANDSDVDMDSPPCQTESSGLYN